MRMLQACYLFSLQYVFELLLRHLHSMMISTHEMQYDMSWSSIMASTMFCYHLMMFMNSPKHQGLP